MRRHATGHALASAPRPDRSVTLLVSMVPELWSRPTLDSRFTLRQMLVSFRKASRLRYRQCSLRQGDVPGRSAMSRPASRGTIRRPAIEPLHSSTGVAHMPNDKDSKPGHAQNGEGGILTNVILLALPLLCLQRALLPKIKSGLERDKDDYTKAIANFASFELHALMMILDRPGTLRSRFDDKLESELKAELTQILEKLAAGVVAFVEIQEIILPRLINMLNEIKNGKRAKTGQG